MTGKEAKKRLERQYKRQNEYIKNNFDRVSVTLPVGTKERIKSTGESINGFICRLVSDELKRLEWANENLEKDEEPAFMRE